MKKIILFLFTALMGFCINTYGQVNKKISQEITLNPPYDNTVFFRIAKDGLNYKVNFEDLFLWADSLRIAEGDTGTVTSVATGYGLLGGPITTTGTITADTSATKLATQYFVNTTDSVGTITKGVWNGTPIDSAYTSNVVTKIERKTGSDSVFTWKNGTKSFTYRDTAGQWTTAASGEKITYPDTVSIGGLTERAQISVFGHDGSSGDFGQLYVDYNSASLYGGIGGSYTFGISGYDYSTIVGDVTEAGAHFYINTNDSTFEVTNASAFYGNTTASDTDHYTTLGDVHNKFEGKDSLSHMIIEFVQTTTDPPTYTIRENTSPYTITGTTYSGIGNYTVEFHDGICTDCFDAGKYYIRTQIFWSYSNGVPVSCFTFPALNSGFTLNIIVGDLMGTYYDDILEPFSIEIVWYHEQ